MSSSTSGFATRSKAKARSNPGQQTEPPPSIPPLARRSPYYFYTQQIDYSASLLGDRWLSRGRFGLVVAPSGHGKSSLVMQSVCLWGPGLSAFYIKPAKPLRILVVQAEDDQNDLIEMSWMLARLNLSADQIELLKENVTIETLIDTRCLGRTLANWIEDFKPDLLILNPLQCYLNTSSRQDEIVIPFLTDLVIALEKYNCACLLIHHTPKTQFQKTEAFSWFDWMYSGAGCAAITDRARCVLIMAPTKVRGTYKFIAAKRSEKIGWEPEVERYFSHSKDGQGHMLWVPSTPEQVAAAKPSRQKDETDILPFISRIDPTPQSEIFAKAKAIQIGRDKTRKFLKDLCEDGRIEKLDIPHQGRKAEIGYRQIQ
jgi:AAA domain